MLTNAGFCINVEKSVTEPTQELKHLGFVLNSNNMTVSLSDDKADSMVNLSRTVLSKDTISIRSAAQLIGTFVSSLPGVKFGQLYYRRFENDKTKALKVSKGHFEAKMSLSDGAKEEITWWIHHANDCPKNVIQSQPNIILQTDASQSGWGATLLSGKSTGGRWHISETSLHINA